MASRSSTFEALAVELDLEMRVASFWPFHTVHLRVAYDVSRSRNRELPGRPKIRVEKLHVHLGARRDAMNRGKVRSDIPGPFCITATSAIDPRLKDVKPRPKH